MRRKVTSTDRLYEVSNFGISFRQVSNCLTKFRARGRESARIRVARCLVNYNFTLYNFIVVPNSRTRYLHTSYSRTRKRDASLIDLIQFTGLSHLVCTHREDGQRLFAFFLPPFLRKLHEKNDFTEICKSLGESRKLLSIVPNTDL